MRARFTSSGKHPLRKVGWNHIGTRGGQWFTQGLSPRAALAWLQAARARALLARRPHLTPEDLQALAVPVLAHRLPPRNGAGRSRAAQVRAMVEAVRLV